MTAIAARSGTFALLACGLAGLALAVALRVETAGIDGVQSIPAGVVFGAALLALSLGMGLQRPRWTWPALAWGVAGAAVLCVPPSLARLDSAGVTAPDGVLPVWAAVVTWVAITEELLLRGALYEAASRWRGDPAAIGLTAVAFALLHVPLYGWHVVPLDLAVGVFLGVLRAMTQSVVAPMTTHVLADLAGWWLR